MKVVLTRPYDQADAAVEAQLRICLGYRPLPGD